MNFSPCELKERSPGIGSCFIRMWSDMDVRTKMFLLYWGAGRQLKGSLMPASLIIPSILLGQLLQVMSQHELFSSVFSLLTLVDPHMVLEYHAEKRCIH